MPYIDQGEPKPPPSMPPVLPIAATLLAMAVGVALFWVFYNQLNLNQWLAPLVTGLLIGLALRLSGKRPLPRAGAIAIAATLVACLVGYVLRHVLWIKWLDPTFQPTAGHAFGYLFSADLMSILLIAMSAYLAYAIAATIPYQAARPADPA